MKPETGLLTLYAQKVPTNDSTLLELTKPSHRRQVHRDVILTDSSGNFKCRWPWYYSNKPTRRNKTVTFNCYKWRLQWLPDSTEVTQ